MERQVHECLRRRRFFFLGLVNGSVSTRAAAISFRLFVAFFPAMILLLSIIPYTPLETEEVLLSLEQFFPKQAIELFESTVSDLIGQRQGTLLSVGVVLLLYYASNSVNAILLDSDRVRTRQARNRTGWYSACCPLAFCWCCRSCWCWRSS